MQTTTQYQRPQLATDWSKTQTPPPTLIGTSPTGELTVKSTDLATGLGIKHKNLLETVQTHKSNIELFGQYAFETETVKNTAGAVNEVKFIYFNENQALFVGSLSRNTIQVVAFKVTLVREFDKARKALATKEGEPSVMVQAMAELISQLSAQVAVQTKKLDAIDRKQEKYIEAKVVVNSQAYTEKKKTDAQEKRDEAMRIASNANQRGFTFTWYSFWDSFKADYKINVYEYEQRKGEHYFDVMVRAGYINQLHEFVIGNYGKWA
jgi:phage regulator Rha-like protein